MKTDHLKILQMIEGVDHDDTDALDAIDAWVFFWLNPEERVYFESISINQYLLGVRDQHYIKQHIPYTRNLDAIKSITPEGYEILLIQDDRGFRCQFDEVRGSYISGSGILPTEELARLHVVVKAIAYERENDN